MKVKLFLLNKAKYRLEFVSCETLEAVRIWLNKSGPFVTIGGHTIINTKQICKIKPLRKKIFRKKA